MAQNNELPKHLDYNTVYAQVRSNSILHAGKIVGWDSVKGEIYLSGRGVKGYPHTAKWVPVNEIKPLDQTEALYRHRDSLTQPALRQRAMKRTNR